MTTNSSPSWAKKVIDLYKDGCSDAEVAATLEVTLKEYYRQITDNPAFAQLVEYGRTLSQAFWERQARQNIGNKGFNTPLWAFYMKNKYQWADKTESITSELGGNVDLDALRVQVTKDVARFMKENTPELTDAQRVLSGIMKEQRLLTDE